MNLGVFVSLRARLMRMMTKMKKKKKYWAKKEKTQCWHFTINLLTVGILFSAFLLVRWFCRIWFIVHRHHWQQSAWCSHTSAYVFVYGTDDECLLMHVNLCGILRLSFGMLVARCHVCALPFSLLLLFLHFTPMFLKAKRYHIQVTSGKSNSSSEQQVLPNQKTKRWLYLI